MKNSNTFFTLIFISFILTGCTGGNNTPGYLFEIIFIVIPVLIIGHYLYKRIETANESLYVVEGQLKKIIAKLEKLEEDTDKTPQSNSKRRTKK